MSIHLHTLVDRIKDKRCFVNNELFSAWRTHRIQPDTFWATESKLMQQAVCFFGGHSEAIDVPHRQDLCRLPFPVVWIEFVYGFKDTSMRVGFLCHEAEDGQLFISGYQNPPDPTRPNDWALMYTSFTQFLGGEYPNERRVVGVSPESFPKQHAEADNSLVLAFLTALNCCNVRRVEHPPSRTLNKSRARKGKQPIFSFWTLELTPSSNDPSVGLDGTHASPRVHLRRGHVRRRHGSDKWWWVQPHMVGRNSPSPGIVHKDYDASALMGAPS